MTVARVRRPTCEARPAAWKASPRTYTPPWKYKMTWRGSMPSAVISAVGTPPSAAAVTVTPAGSGCADVSSASRRRSSLTLLSAGKADCQDRVEVLSLLGAHRGSPFGWNSPGSAPGRARPCRTNAEIPAGRRTTTRLAARQVRKRHQLTVIRDGPGAPKLLMVLTAGDGGLEREQGIHRANGSDA